MDFFDRICKKLVAKSKGAVGIAAPSLDLSLLQKIT